MAPAARAASWSFLTFGTVSTQRGRTPQFRFAISRISNAVVLTSTETGFSSGTGGTFTVFHSEMMSEADNVPAPNKTIAITAAAAAMQQDAIRTLLMDVPPLIETEYSRFLGTGFCGNRPSSRWGRPNVLS